MINPFATVGVDKTEEENEQIRKRIDTMRREINSNEDRINELEKEIENIERLIEINAFYSDKKTNEFLWIN